MTTINGVEISLFKNQGHDPVIPGRFGHLGQLFAGDEIQMQVRPKTSPASIHRVLLTSDIERHNVRELPVREPGVNRYFEHIVPIVPGKPFDEPNVNKNCFHIVEMDGKGIVVITNVLIIAQRGEFFLLSQETYRVQACKGPRGVMVPELWEQAGFRDVCPWIEKVYENRPDISLPSITDCKRSEPSYNLDDVPDEHHAVVKFWSARYQTGVIVRPDGSHAKAYWGNIKCPERFPAFLVKGEVVRVGRYRPAPGRSKLSLEAVEITRPQLEEVMAE